jgi:predicted small integral membrane protein
MIARMAKVALVFSVALFYTLVVFGNVTDYDANYQFVRHVLMMDSIFPGDHRMWRAMNQPTVHTLSYLSIIVWEGVTAILCWAGGLRLARALRSDAAAFHRAKSLAIGGLVVGMLLWLVAFITIGGEWFMMWQSRTWNGQEAAFRMFTIIGVVLLFLVLPDADVER